MSQEFFSEAQKEQIVQAIRVAEARTSGEIRVHVEQRLPQPDVMARAREVFVLLKLDQTQLRNGVLFYLALEDRKFAILGDKGIDAVVPADFWNRTLETMRAHFRQQNLAEGLCAGIHMAGEQLSARFPAGQNDINELSDDISFGS